jgi:hypothetical protein
MTDKLVTVATYTEPTAAHLARQQLEAEGIHCFVGDDTTTGMDWLLGNAIGWVKLQVLESDAERATALLERPSQPVEEPPSTAIVEAGPHGEPPPPRLEEDEEPAENERSKQAGRALRAALFGLLFCPLEFYAFYLLMDVYGAEEPLEGRARRHVMYASLINVPFMAVVLLVVVAYLGAELNLW